MSKVETTVQIINTIKKTFDAVSDGEYSSSEIRNCHLANITTLLGDIALSLAVIADNVEKDKTPHTPG